MSDDGARTAGDESSEQKDVRETTESHVKSVEQDADAGRLSRRQAERIISSGQKATRSHDMYRGVVQRDET